MEEKARPGGNCPMDFKAVAITVFILVYLYQLLLSVIGMRSEKNPIPANVADVYDQETYERWRAYHAEKSRFGILTSTASFVIDLVLLVSNAYAAFAGLFPANPVTQVFAVMLLPALTSILLLPFAWHNTMVIEEKYGFNRTTPRTFWADQVKEFVISLGLLTGIGALLIWVHQALGDWLVPVFAALMTLFMMLFSFLYPVMSKIFNKFEPLEEGELRGKLAGLLEKNGYHVRDIKVMDASRRTTKSNAYFTGFGKMKTIVLYDTLVQSMTADEICAVFAHEMGHGLNRDTLKNNILSFFQMLLIGAMAFLILREKGIFTSCGFDGVNYGFAVTVIAAFLGVLSPLTGYVINAHSRRAEYRADAQAVREGYAEQLITGLKKLSRDNYADLSPDKLLVKLTYSHPPLSMRIDAIRNRKQGA